MAPPGPPHCPSEARHGGGAGAGGGSAGAAASAPTTTVQLLEIEGDMLSCDADYIAHQCNCTTRGAKGLARAMFSRFPYADTYRRGARRVAGACDVWGDGSPHRRFVLNLYGQHGVGKGVPRGNGGGGGNGGGSVGGGGGGGGGRRQRRRGGGGGRDGGGGGGGRRGGDGKPAISLVDPANGRPDDSKEAREEYFQQSLCAFEQLVGTPFTGSIAFPFGIGCNLAGGDWPKYRSMIMDFARRHPGASVMIYKLPGARLPRQRPRKQKQKRKQHQRTRGGMGTAAAI